MLSIGQHLALATPWWSWRCAAVRKALWASILMRLRKLGNERMKANDLVGRSPASWKDISGLRKDEKTQARALNGSPSLELFVGLAGALGIDSRECIPDTETWIAEAAVHLSHYAEGRVRPIGKDDALAYCRIVLPWTRAGMRTMKELERDLAELTPVCRTNVLNVASGLSPILEKAQPRVEAIACKDRTMNGFEEHEIAAYVLGDASADLAERIRAAAATDEQLAAELDALASIRDSFETLDELPAPGLAPRPRTRVLLHRAAMAFGILVATAGVAWGGYELLHTPPLLKDDFSTRTLSYETWHPHLGRRGVSATDRYLRLLNRGSVVTRREFDEPIEIEFDWRWIDHGNYPLYGEVFTVCLRTNGEHKPNHAFEILDGLEIEFNIVENRVRAIMFPREGGTAIDSAPMPAGEWHHIRIIDDGAWIAVYIEGPSIDPRYKSTPILAVPVPDNLTGRRVSFFNREHTNDIDHESHVDNIRIRRFQN